MNKHKVKKPCPVCEKDFSGQGMTNHLRHTHPEWYESLLKYPREDWGRCVATWRLQIEGQNLDRSKELSGMKEEFWIDSGGNKVWASYGSQIRGDDPVEHPAHYNFGKFEVIEVLEEWFPSEPLLWQVGKYLARAGRKGSMLEDLKKARWYLDRRIRQLEGGDAGE